jgi:hypothetical protein
VGFEEGAPTTDVRSGDEQGLALRVRSGEATGFAATSGASEASLRWVLAACRKIGGDGPWGEPDGAEEWIDDDGPLELPTPEALEHWLGEAREALGDSRAAPHGLRVGWVEVAMTRETLVTPRGRVRCRSRARAWSSVTPRLSAGGAPAVRTAARHFRDLRPQAWRLGLEDRATSGADAGTVARGSHAVLFTPECSARLALALARELHEGASGELAVGPGWRVTDDPAMRGALFGAEFDDLGHPTSSTELADGNRRLADLARPGHYRRSSFRDRPQPRPFHLVVAATPGEPAPDSLLVDRLEVHPSGEAWVLLAGGRSMRAEGSWPRFSDVRIRTSPQELALRCIAGVGPPRESHLGLVTPALLFEGLPIG